MMDGSGFVAEVAVGTYGTWDMGDDEPKGSNVADVSDVSIVAVCF